MIELKKIKFKLKSEGVTYLKRNPSKILYLPFVFLSVIINRLKREDAEIYIMEMPLEKRKSDSEYDISCFKNPDILTGFARQREQEENLIAGSYEHKIRERMKQGDWFIAASDKTTVISLLFVSNKRKYFESAVETYIDIPSGSIAIYDVYTLGSYRKKGIYTSVFNYCMNDLYTKGYKKALLWVMKHNQPSIIVHHRLGMKHVKKKISFHRKFGFRWYNHEDLDFDSLQIISNEN